MAVPLQALPMQAHVNAPMPAAGASAVKMAPGDASASAAAPSQVTGEATPACYSMCRTSLHINVSQPTGLSLGAGILEISNVYRSICFRAESRSCSLMKCLHRKGFRLPPFGMSCDKRNFKLTSQGPVLQVPHQQQQSHQHSQRAGQPPRMRRAAPTSGIRPPRRCSGIGPQLIPPYHDALTKAQLWGSGIESLSRHLNHFTIDCN